MKTFLKSFFRDESGASAAEYALILAIVGVALGGAALALSFQISESMKEAASDIEMCRGATPNAEGNCETSSSTSTGG